MSEARVIDLFPEIISQKEPDPKVNTPLPDDLGKAVEMLIQRLRETGPLK